MGWEAWYTLAVVLGTMLVLARAWLPPSGAMLGAMIAVLAAGVVTPTEALSGFANPAPITIAALYVLAKGVEKTGVLAPMVSWMLGRSDNDRVALARMALPTTAVSGFLNNTPIVAMLIPQVEAWSRARGRSVSRYLMPLSFAAIIGGALTVMGTATNIVASGLLQSIGEEPLGFFEITWVGLPIALVALAALVLLSPSLIPERRSAHTVTQEGIREFVVDMTVVADGGVDGNTVEGAGLRHLSGMFLAAMEREGDTVAPLTPGTRLLAGDRLRFVGRAGDIVDLQAIPGLMSTESAHMDALDGGEVGYFEAVVGADSPLVGEGVRESGFRSRYQAAIIGVHRAGERVDAKIGDLTLQVGDTLMLVSDSGFRDRWADRRDFLLISPLRPAAPVASASAPLVGAVGMGIVAAAATGLVPLVTAALVGSMALVLAGAVTPSEARRSVNLDVLVTIAAAFGLAAAIEASGLGTQIAEALVALAQPFGSWATLGAVVVVTVILKEVITNKGAVLLLMPIGFSLAATTGSDPRGYAIAIAVASALSFLTPIGFQTNTMVYGPGGYRFGDYLRLGIPLTLISLVGILVIVPLRWAI